jgi:N-methylhydantoinase A
LASILDDFHREHDRAYGFSAPGEAAQFVTLRLEARGLVPTPDFPEIERASGRPEPEATRRVHLDEAGGWLDTPIYEREHLRAGQRFDGPAIVEQMDSTTLVLPGQTVEVDAVGNLMIHEQGR